MKGMVVYESFTGNTKRIARAIAKGAKLKAVHVNAASIKLEQDDILILGSLDIKAKPAKEISEYLKDVRPPKCFGVFMTYGVPVWGPISSKMCISHIRKILRSKGSRFIGSFMCPGYHYKFHTFKKRPNEKDEEHAQEFGERCLRSALALM